MTQTPGVAHLLPRLRRLGSAVCVSPCTAYTLAGDSISRDCISPASHQATPGSMQPSRPSPLSPHLLNRRGAQSARPPRSAPSVPPSLRVTCHCGGADASPHSAPLLRPRRPAVARLLHYPALCCAASPSPRRRAAAALCRDAVAAASPSPLRRRRRCVAVTAASPSPRRRAAAASPSPRRRAALCRRRLAVALLRRRHPASELPRLRRRVPCMRLPRHPTYYP